MHPSTQADNLKLRISVSKVEVVRQGTHNDKLRIVHESEKIQVSEHMVPHPFIKSEYINPSQNY